MAWAQFVFLSASLCWAVQQAPSIPDATLKSLADSVRGLLVQSLPETLYEASPNWGHTRQAANQLKWKGVRPKIYKTAKNNGTNGMDAFITQRK